MVDLLTNDQIRELAAVRGRCITIAIPTSSAGRERLEGPVRLKNQIERAHAMLVAEGMRPTLAHDLLLPATELLPDQEFWMEQTQGLVILIGEGRQSILRLPVAVPELAVVGNHFHIRPLLLAVIDQEAFVLALDAKHTRLLRIEGEKVEEVDVPAMPHSIEEALGPEYSEKQRQMRSLGPNSHQGSVSHGAGDRGSDVKDRDLRFSQAIDRALVKFINGNHARLILAADEPMLSIYRNASHLTTILEEPIVGSPRRVTLEQLAVKARSILARERDEKIRALLDQCHTLEPLGRTEADLNKLIGAAKEGRVASLLLDRESLRWGFTDRPALELVPEQAPGSEDLLNLAAIETLANGGQVIEVGEEPELAAAGAIGTLRY